MNISINPEHLDNIVSRINNLGWAIEELAGLYDLQDKGGTAHLLRLFQDDLDGIQEAVEELTLPDTTHLLPPPPFPHSCRPAGGLRPPWERTPKAKHMRRFRPVTA